ncbi:C-X-C motif chemokine 6-like [Mugil cephalus]|uniref:C-X-C motif chemokine 6-like n=1 Tax=Mugil cephalus TaxID=48193 RepID=UPI001FB619B4|nr:C-X-C motif chemokine 6-like [Mugil cephalus]
MSSMIKVFLLLAVMVCISKAQLSEQQCLCHRVRNGIGRKSEIKDVQIYLATNFCNKVEIVVTMNSGLRYCLNPKLMAVKKLLTNIMKNTSTTAGSTNTCIAPSA